jgi:5-methylcytosine-specific restriction protein B
LKQAAEAMPYVVGKEFMELKHEKNSINEKESIVVSEKLSEYAKKIGIIYAEAVLLKDGELYLISSGSGNNNDTEYVKKVYDDLKISINENIQLKATNENLNKKIAELIGNNYQLGHSYFLKIVPLGNSIPDVSKRILFQNELKSILTEYLKSIFDEKDIAKHLEDLSNIFIPKRKDINDTNS